jgi:hypothetical protein
MEEVMKEGNGGKNTKEGFTEVHKHKKMKNPIRGKMVQGYGEEPKNDGEKEKQGDISQYEQKQQKEQSHRVRDREPSAH